MDFSAAFASITSGAKKPDADFERRYQLVAEADKLASGHYTEYAHAIHQTKMLAEILAILAMKEHND